MITGCRSDSRFPSVPKTHGVRAIVQLCIVPPQMHRASCACEQILLIKQWNLSIFLEVLGFMFIFAGDKLYVTPFKFKNYGKRQREKWEREENGSRHQREVR